MKTNLTLKALLVMVLIQSCQSQTPGFDLFNLKFSEEIDAIVEQNNLKLSDGKSEALTLFGYDRFETTDSALLQFDKIPIIGELNGKNNNLILHYSTDNRKISMYEINLYTETEVENISKTLDDKIGTPSHSSKNNDGLEMKVWKDDKTKIYYFMMSYKEENLGRKTEFTVIDMKNERANEWISFRSFNYYL